VHYISRRQAAREFAEAFRCSEMNSLRHEDAPIPFQRKLSLEGSRPLLVKLLGSKGSADRFLFIAVDFFVYSHAKLLLPLFRTIAWVIHGILRIGNRQSSVVCSEILPNSHSRWINLITLIFWSANSASLFRKYSINCVTHNCRFNQGQLYLLLYRIQVFRLIF